MGRHKLLRIPEGQERLPFKAKRSGVLTYATHRERYALVAMGILIALSMAMYTYSVMASVMHVASREELMQKSALIEAKIADLEQSYLAGSLHLSSAYAGDLGFRHTESHTFVEKSGAFTLNTPR